MLREASIRRLAVVFLGLSAAALGACSASSDPSGTPSSGGSTAAGGTTAAAGTSAGVAGGGAASGGSPTAGSAGTATSGGMSASGAGGAATGGGGQAGAAAGGGASGSGAVACPADATFCSGFEDAALPTGAVYKVNAAPGDWSRDFAVDTTVFHGGKSALRVKSGTDAGTSGSAYQMLAVPAPMGVFWARFYIRQDDLDIGGVDHNVFAGAADSDEPNSQVMVELAEDVGIAFNTNDDVRWPMGYGRVNGSTMPFSLPKGMWHCIEISYDSQKREQHAYVGGKQIDATNYPANVASPFKNFKFGFNKLHGPARAVWYDDVAVGPTRPGCL